MKPWRKPEVDPAQAHWPSIQRQTPWPVGIFSFGKAEEPEKVAYFNPGLVERPDGLWLVTRRSENRPGITIGMNSLMAFKLDGYLAPMYGVPVKMMPRFPNEHFEDARAVQVNGTTWVSCSNFIVFPHRPKELWTGSQITVAPVNDRWQAMDRFDPQYGNNAKPNRAAGDIEKNWLPFGSGGRLHIIYAATPNHVVVAFDEQMVPVETWETSFRHDWAYGHIRGGTPPVRMGESYITFFHSSIPLLTKYRRRYFMGAYEFDAQPPFKIRAMTREPILAGSDEDEWWPKKPLVVFPCGAVLQGPTWLITLGVNDLKCAWIKIPHIDLMRRLKPLG